MRTGARFPHVSMFPQQFVLVSGGVHQRQCSFCHSKPLLPSGMCRAMMYLGQCLYLVAVGLVAAWIGVTSDWQFGVYLGPLLFAAIALSWRGGRATMRWRSRLFGDLFIEVSTRAEQESAKGQEKGGGKTFKSSPKAVGRVTDSYASGTTGARARGRAALGIVDTEAAVGRVTDSEASGSTGARARDRAALGLVDTEATALACPVCGSPMEKRSARKGGKFWGCTRWPLCDATRKSSDPCAWSEGPRNRAIRTRIEHSG